MKISSITSFKANFNSCERFLCDAEKQAYNTGRLKEFRKATWNIARCFPDGEIEKYSTPEKDIFCLTPNKDINISVHKKIFSQTQELDSLIELSRNLQKLD